MDLKGKTVIRFDGPPGPDGPRFIEAEKDGKSVNVGEWVPDGDEWLLVLGGYRIDPGMKAWWATRNSDLTEGRGHTVSIAICKLRATAKRLAHLQDVQGTDGPVNEVELFRYKGQTYGPVIVNSGNKEDEKTEVEIDKRQAAIKRAKDLGLTDDEIAAIKN